MSTTTGIVVRVNELIKGTKKEKDFSTGFYAVYMEPLLRMAAANYLTDPTSPDKVRTEEEFKEVEPYIQANLKNNIDYVAMAFDSESSLFVGYMFCLRNRVLEIYVAPLFRQRGIGALMINQFKTDRFKENNIFQAKWERDTAGVLTKLFLKCGFDVTLHNDIFNNSLEGYYAEAPGNQNTSEDILAAMDKGYIDFRGDYAVVDGHFTIKELEALLVVARKELKDAE